MLYPCITDQLTVIPSGTISSFAASQTFSARIKQEKRRLEALLISVTQTAHGASQPSAMVGDGAIGLIKAIRLRVNDVLGSRNLIEVSGPGLLSFNRNNFGTIDRYSWQCYHGYYVAAQNLATVMNFYVPIRHPLIAEPYGNLLSLPLSSNFLKDDPILEIETNPLASVYTTTGTPTGTIQVFSVLREVPDTVPYIPSELRTDTLNAGTSAVKQTYEFSSVGFLTQFLVQGYSAQTYAPSVTRISPLSSGGLLSVEYGRNAIRKFNDNAIYALNDLSQEQWLASANDNMTIRALTGEYFIDFLTDHPTADAFSPMSLVNLNTEALNGDKCRLVIDTMVANSQARITYHKLLARTSAALKDLAVAI